MHNDKPFGGKCVLMSGDWRQVGPVLKFGTPSEVVEHAFLSSRLWQHVQRFRLSKSMRDKDDLLYAKTVLVTGEGAIQPIELGDGSEVIPLSHTVTNDDTQTTCSIVGITDFEDLVNTIYPDLLSVDHSARTMPTASNRHLRSPHPFRALGNHVPKGSLVCICIIVIFSSVFELISSYEHF